MATLKGYKRKARADIIETFVDVECWWEYQTTADIFSYHEVILEDFYGYGKIEKGSHTTEIRLGPDAARRLYHALAHWMGSYNSEKEMMQGIENNMFKYNEELDGEE